MWPSWSVGMGGLLDRYQCLSQFDRWYYDHWSCSPTWWHFEASRAEGWYYQTRHSLVTGHIVPEAWLLLTLIAEGKAEAPRIRYGKDIRSVDQKRCGDRRNLWLCHSSVRQDRFQTGLLGLHQMRMGWPQLTPDTFLSRRWAELASNDLIARFER